MKTIPTGTIVRLSRKQPVGSDLLTRYPGMTGVVLHSTYGMAIVEWRFEGTDAETVIHYNHEILEAGAAR